MPFCFFCFESDRIQSVHCALCMFNSVCYAINRTGEYHTNTRRTYKLKEKSKSKAKHKKSQFPITMGENKD